MDERREAAAVAALAFAFAGPLAYVAQRVVEVLRSPPIDPTLVLMSTHVAFFWRASTATWWGVLAAGVAYALVRRGVVAPERASRVAAVAALPLVLVCVALTWVFP